MLSAAADHLYLTGSMATAEHLDLRGQSYYTKALELALAAGDHHTYCTTLRGMSVQAAELGYGAPALRYANAATATSPEAGPRMRAFLAGQQAHALALARTGDHCGALAMLHEAEVAMEQANLLDLFGRSESGWASRDEGVRACALPPPFLLFVRRTPPPCQPASFRARHHFRYRPGTAGSIG